MQVKSKLNGSLMTVLIFAGVLIFTSNPQVASAEISADTYCQLVIQSMQQEVSNLQELIALANQYQRDPQTLAQQEELKRLGFDAAKDAVFDSFGTTAEEYVTYMGKKMGER